MWTLVRTDFKARYHGTLSGFVWALLKPLTMFAVLTAVFSLVFRREPHYKLDLLIGLFLWDFFAEGTKVGLTALHAKGFLLTKARFPAWILVVTSIANPLLTILVFSVTLVVFLWVAGPVPTLAVLGLFLAYLVAMGLLIMGFSLGGSVLFLRYRDLNQLWDVITQAGFFFTPIIYPLSALPDDKKRLILHNPMTHLVEAFRTPIYQGAIPSSHVLITATVSALGSLVLGWLVFAHYSDRVAYHV